jgi:hypothetical protein
MEEVQSLDKSQVLFSIDKRSLPSNKQGKVSLEVSLQVFHVSSHTTFIFHVTHSSFESHIRVSSHTVSHTMP